MPREEEAETTAYSSSSPPTMASNNNSNTSNNRNNSGANLSTGAVKPVRRRRLARRRQYAKSRRLASSYLRSQFVHYDTLSSKFESESSVADNWCRVQTLNDNSSSNEQSGIHYRSDGQLPVASEPDHLDLMLLATRAAPAAASLPQNWTHFDGDSGAKTTSMIGVTTAAIASTCMAAYSSSSLESYSPIDSCPDQQQQQHHLIKSPLAFSAPRSRLAPAADSKTQQSSERVVRSETVDAVWSSSELEPSQPNRSNSSSNNSSSNNKSSSISFFPPFKRNLVIKESPSLSSSPSAAVVVAVAAASAAKTLTTRQPLERSKVLSRSAFRIESTDNIISSSSIISSASGHFISFDSQHSSALRGQQQHHDNRPKQQHSLPHQSELPPSSRPKCIDNVHFNDLFHGSVNDSSSVTINQSVRTDPRLYKDDVDIKFSRALNSCKLPQIRYASKERLFERLTDLRFLSIDFLNTFLLTYRVFTTAENVLESLKSVHYNCDRYIQQQHQQQHQQQQQPVGNQTTPVGQVRDSFSAYTNASLNSLDQSSNQETLRQASGDQSVSSADQQQAEKSPRSGHEQQQQQQQQNRQPPQIPSRSPASELANPSKQNNFLTANSFLLGSQQSKRRSTISALTPITGSNASSLANLNPCKRQQQLSQNLIPDGSNAGADDTLPKSSTSPHEDLVLKFSEDEERFSESSSIVDANDRARSCSMTSDHHLPSPVAAASSALSIGSSCLLVPGGRQVRASSFSHATDFVRSAKESASSEHWRLSYKKSASATKPPIVGPHAMHLLSPMPRTSLANSLAPRRASSSDVNVTFQVDPPPPPPPSSSSPGQTNDQCLVIRTPAVPPSTPNEPTEPPQSSRSQTDREQIKLALEQSSHNAKNKRQGRNKQSANSSMSGSASSLSLSSSDSNSSKLVSSSHSESGLIQTTSESSDDNSASGEAPKPKRNNLSARRRNKHRQLARNGSNGAVMLKEIDLTVSRTIDCDTSADEDKVSTSSGEDDQHEERHSRSKRVAKIAESDGEDDEEEKSFKLLTRLNSVKLSDADDNSESDDSENRERHQRTDEKAKLMLKENGHTNEATKAKQQTEAKPKEATRESDEQQKPNDGQTRKVSTPTKTPEAQLGNSTSWGSTQTVGGLQSTSCQTSSRMTTPRSSFQHHAAADPTAGGLSKAGVIVTSSAPRVSTRRSSTASAASAFAAATAASNNPLLTKPPASMRPPPPPTHLQQQHQQQRKGSISFLSQGRPSQGHIYQDVGDLNACHCFSIHQQQQQQRASICGPQVGLQRRTDLNCSWSSRTNRHQPNCVYAHQQQVGAAISPSQTPVNMANPLSDASSLCNSRASSRLSSSAGLDYSSAYSSAAQVNFYSMSQNQQQSLASDQQQQLHGRQQRSSIAGGLNQRTLAASPAAGGQATGSANSKKRNSTQINIRSVATIRVLSVLRHWVSKHSQDFVNDTKLSHLAQEFLRDLIMDPNLLPAEHKAAQQLQQMIQKAAHSRGNQVDLDLLLAPPPKPSPDSIETLSALEIAEGMTYLDHKIFLAIRSEEFLGQAWMKMDKAIRAPHILLITKRFNDVSRLVSSEIIRVPELHRRVAIIEKWTNVAHICRVVHNFNGVLQICAAFTNSAVFRLKKTWDKIPKTTKSTIDQLQSLVSTDSRFRNMRDAINRCDPPSIPYVGMYLTDLSFIEEGTPNYSPDGLLNFSKMRMIAHVIREIQHLQNGSYKIELNQRVANYLLDSSRHLQDDEMYRCSLAIEPRSSSSKSGAVQMVINPNPQQPQPQPQPQPNLQNGSSLSVNHNQSHSQTAAAEKTPSPTASQAATAKQRSQPIVPVAQNQQPN